MGRGLRFLLNIEKHEKKRMGKLKLGKTLAESAENAERLRQAKAWVFVWIHVSHVLLG